MLFRSIDQLQGRPTGSIQGRRLPRRLMRVILHARSKVELASRSANDRAVPLLTAAEKKLQRFTQLVTKGFSFARVEENLMHVLTERARVARDIIEGVKAQLQGLS